MEEEAIDQLPTHPKLGWQTDRGGFGRACNGWLARAVVEGGWVEIAKCVSNSLPSLCIIWTSLGVFSQLQ